MNTLIIFLGVFTLACARTFIDPPKDFIDPPKQDFRIVNGTETKPHAYPFMARISVIWGLGYGLCGATILNKDYIVTAAHCLVQPLTGLKAKLVLVYVGDHSVSKADPNEALYISTENTLDNYNRFTHHNDIAIIKLRKSITFNSDVQPACIVAEDSDYVGTTATAAGWGTLGSKLATSDVLREAPIPILGNDVCQKSYILGYSPDSMLCGGYTDGSKDTCQGDSGGPLFINKDGKFTIVGLTSFGRDCAKAGYPGVYTRVAAFNSFIKQTVGEVCVN